MNRQVKSVSVLLGIILVVLCTLVGVVSPLLAQDPRDKLVSLVSSSSPVRRCFTRSAVILKGYVVLEFENQHMYLSEADAKHRNNAQ